MTSKDFKIKYTEINREEKDKLINNKTLKFQVKGDEKYGLDKTIVNGIRRTLLTDIETVAFNPDDIIISNNTGSLHNEFIKHRISLIPLYINPENYYRNLLFELKIKIDDNPTKNVYNSDFNIYPLKSEYQKLIDEQHKLEFIPDDINIFNKLQKISKDYYDLLNPLSEKEKNEIFRPFEFPKKNFNYFLLTELKQTGSDTDIQELDLYCVPSIGTSREHARFNNLPTIVYSYSKDKKAFEKYLADQIKIEKPKDPVIDLEKYSIKEKMAVLKKDKMKEMQKWEKLDEDKTTWRTNGLSNIDDLYKVEKELKKGNITHYKVFLHVEEEEEEEEEKEEKEDSDSSGFNPNSDE